MKKIYLIIEEGWDGIGYNYNQVSAFTTKESRDKEYERMTESRSVKEANSYLITDETMLLDDMEV